MYSAYLYVHICTYVYTYAYMYIYVHVCMIVETFVIHYMYIYWQQCSWLQQHSYMYICTHTYVYRIYIYIYAHTHKYKHIYILFSWLPLKPRTLLLVARNSNSPCTLMSQTIFISETSVFHRRGKTGTYMNIYMYVL